MIDDVKKPAIDDESTGNMVQIKAFIAGEDPNQAMLRHKICVGLWRKFGYDKLFLNIRRDSSDNICITYKSRKNPNTKYWVPFRFVMRGYDARYVYIEIYDNTMTIPPAIIEIFVSTIVEALDSISNLYNIDSIVRVHNPPEEKADDSVRTLAI
jgi:hypothetical protein